jgi:hypothetical protein
MTRARVILRLVRDRYTLIELLVRTEVAGVLPRHRRSLFAGRSHLAQAWDLIFDEVAYCVDVYGADDVELIVDVEDASDWRRGAVMAVASVAAHELGVRIGRYDDGSRDGRQLSMRLETI